MKVASLLDRPVYLYSEVDRLLGLRGGTSRRWVNGYSRPGRSHEPILRAGRLPTDWATWGEFVGARILAEYQDMNIAAARLRAAVTELRDMFGTAYPLAYLRPYLAAEPALGTEALGRSDESQPMVLRTRQLLLGAPGRKVIESATLATDEHGESYAAELPLDPEFPGIVVNPQRLGGQPTLAGRRVEVTTIAGMIDAGERPEELAAGYRLSVTQVAAAVRYVAKHGMARV